MNSNKDIFTKAYYSLNKHVLIFIIPPNCKQPKYIHQLTIKIYYDVNDKIVLIKKKGIKSIPWLNFENVKIIESSQIQKNI